MNLLILLTGLILVWAVLIFVILVFFHGAEKAEREQRSARNLVRLP